MCKIVNSLSKMFSVLPVLGVTALLLAPATGARAGADFDGAAGALIALPADFVGDVFGGLGLIGAAGLGAAGDLVSLVDDNSVTRKVLQGIGSRALGRAALAVSHTASGALEGGRAEQLAAFPEPGKLYVKRGEKVSHNTVQRLGTLHTGIGAAVPLAVADVVTNSALVVTRMVGSENADSIATWQNDFRGHMVGRADLPAVAAR